MNFSSLPRMQELVTELKTRILSKVSKSGDTMTGDLNVGSAKVRTNGCGLFTWVQSTADLKLTTPATKIVVHHNGWFYTRTVEQIKQDLGISDSSLNVTVENGKLVFYSGGTVEGSVLIVG